MPVTEVVKVIGAPPPIVPSWVWPVVELIAARMALNSLLNEEAFTVCPVTISAADCLM
jgi:hypothetical protein